MKYLRYFGMFVMFVCVYAAHEFIHQGATFLSGAFSGAAFGIGLLIAQRRSDVHSNTVHGC